MTELVSETVDITTDDGIADAYFVRPDDDAAHPGVLLYTDAFGLRPNVRAMADRLAAAGYAVLAPNLYYRHGRAPVVDLPEFIDFTQRTGLFEKVMPMAQEVRVPAVAQRDAGHFLDWLNSHSGVAAGPVGVTGYCLGAVLSLRAAATHPERVAAAAGFHGGSLATEDADSPHLLVGQVTGELYFGHADHDPSLPPEQIERLAAALRAADDRHRAEVYPDAPHGYTQADTSVYDADATERHWSALLDLFARNLHA